jgi:hypothetical protein
MLTQRLLVDLKLSSYLGLSEAKSRSALDEGALLGGRLIFGSSKHFFRSGSLNPETRARYPGNNPAFGASIGGGHVGYQIQLNQWVLGIEGSVDGTSLTKNVQVGFPAFLGGSTLTTQTSADVHALVRRQFSTIADWRATLLRVASSVWPYLNGCRLYRTGHRLLTGIWGWVALNGASGRRFEFAAGMAHYLL